MKGDVEILTILVDSYIADLNSAISAISAERIVKGNLSMPEQARLNELVNRLRHVEHQKDKALYIEADFIDTEKSIRQQEKMKTTICNNCGIEGIHACLGKPIKQEDLPEGVVSVNSINNTKNYYCKSCGGFVEYDKSAVLMSEPPKYKGTCKSCGDICYKLCTDM